MYIPKLLQNTRKTAATKHQNASNKWSTIDQKWVLELPRRPLGQETCCWNLFWSFLEPKWIPKWSQNNPTSMFCLLAFPIPFFFDFWAISDHFWCTCEARFYQFWNFRKSGQWCSRVSESIILGTQGLQNQSKDPSKNDCKKRSGRVVVFCRVWLLFGSILEAQNEVKSFQTMWNLRVFWSCPGGGMPSSRVCWRASLLSISM